MTELKTLKDLDTKCEDVCPEICNSIEIIRQEAIKQIKESEKESKRLSDKDLTNYPKLPRIKIVWKCPECNKNILADKPITNWIKHFFNITEEDLKCQKKS